MTAAELYPLARAVHLITVAITIALFTLRGVWMLARSPLLRRTWVRVLPHVNDTLLLASAIVLAFATRQAPWVHGWLAAKVIGLVVYIGLGMIALRRGRSLPVRASAWVAALVVLGYIVAVAVTRQPMPGLR